MSYYRRDPAPPPEVGDRFGQREVLEILPVKPGAKHRRAKVRCDCGDVADVYLAELRAGRSDRCMQCRDNRQRDIKRKGRLETKRCAVCDHVYNVRQGDAFACPQCGGLAA